MNLPGEKAGGGEGLWRLTLILGVLFFGLAYTVLVTGLGSVQSGETNLTVWDDSDSQIVYANYSVIYANYTNATSGNSINGSNVWCEFRHNKTGLWTSAVNMSFNPSTLQYEIIADGKYLTNHTTTMPIGIYSLNVSCFNDLSYANVSATDLINVSSYSTALAIENDTGKVVNEQTYFYANYSKDGGFGIAGLGSEIGQVVWNSSDMDAADTSNAITYFDCENKGKKDCVIMSATTTLVGFYSNGTRIGDATWWDELNDDGYEIEVFDADNDGYFNEFVVVGADDRARVFNETGAEVWNSGDLGTAVYSVVIADLDNDGIKDDFAVGMEISYGSVQKIMAYNTSDGTTWINFWNSSNEFSSRIYEVVVGDFDRDGDDDVAGVAYNAGNLMAFVGDNGTLIFNTSSIGNANSLIAVDLDHDGFNDEIVVGDAGDLFAFKWNGTWGSQMSTTCDGGVAGCIWKTAATSSWSNEVLISDLDNDGWKDDIVVGDTGTIWGFDNNSGQLWSFTEPTGAILSLSEGDVNNDGEAEIIAGGSDGIIWVLNKSGSLLWSYNISLGNIGGVSGSSPAIDISDINNDGINDIAVASVNGYAHILQSVTCSANFNDSTSFNMTWNNTIKKWQVNKSFSTTGDYDWNATCTKNGYTEQTSSETVTISADTTSPTVNLISPANASTDTDGNITFIYNATDNVGIANCSLYTNINGTWLLNQTSTPIVSGNNSFNITEIADGTYNWNVLCYDVNSLSDWNGANWTFTIDASDISPPIVLLEFPANNTLNTTDNSPDFVFNVTEEKASTLDCTLWLNNSAGNTTAYGNNASVLNATSTTITANTSLADGDYKWWISCFDGTNTNSSGKWNISINVDTIYASSCNKSDVESAVTIASTGDTVIVPAGNCTWNSTLSITKGIILQGAGIDNTTLINEINNTGTGDFLISINPSIIADNPYIEITGFTFDANSEGGCIRISCEDNTYSYTNFRVHHNKLKNTLDDDNSYMSFRVKGDCFGLVDNNQFVDNQYDFKIYGDDQDSWDDYPGINNLGSANYLYIENSTSTGASSFILTSGEGARWVYRYNTVNISNLSSANLILDAHGNTQNDGVVAFEGYENVFTDGSGGTMVDIRGGTSMVYNNDWQMPASNGKIQIREEDCYVNNNCDYPGTDPITDTYVWNNYKSNLNNTLVSYIEGDNETYNLIEEDRDYWTDMKIGAEGGEDSLNFFYNLSANRNATCTEDESYWETDTRKLYRCVENNTWNSIYSPFDYPHPLVSGIPGVSLFSPLNMNSTTNTTVQFNASVIDSGTLSNMTLYGNWSGSWSANETISLSSTYNESSFTKTLSAGTYLWNVYSCDVDNNCDWGNLNYTLTITAVDTTSPTVNLVSPANNTLETSSNSITFTYNVTDASSVSNCSLIINNQVNSTNTSITKDTNQTFTQTLSNADYNWSVNCTDSANNVGSSGVYNLSVNVVVDNEYPVFSSYYDNNASLTGSGIALFNVTVLSTNGSVFLEINGTNYTATNLTANVYNTSVNFTISGTWNYYWGAWGNGSSANYNTSVVRSYTVNASADTTPPNITLIIPANNSGDSEGNITFNYNVTDSSSISNCSLVFNGNSNQTNTPITKSVVQNFTLNNLAVGSYNWSVNCTDSANNINNSETRSFAVMHMTGFSGNTTDLSAVNISNITHFIIENASHGKINFSEAVDLSSGADIDSYVNVSANRIEINSSALPALNVSARLILYNLSFSIPRVLRDSSACPSTICTEVSYSGGNFIFDVTQFSVYSADETPGSSSSSSSSGGGSGVSSTSTYTVSDEQFESGYSRKIKVNNRFKFNIKNKTHTLKLVSLTNTTAVINVSSKTQQATLAVGDTRKFELTNDSYYDLSATLNSIENKKANLTIQSVYEQITSEAVKEEKEKEKTAAETEQEEKTAEKGAKLWKILIGVLAVIFLVIISVVVYIKRRK